MEKPKKKRLELHIIQLVKVLFEGTSINVRTQCEGHIRFFHNNSPAPRSTLILYLHTLVCFFANSIVLLKKSMERLNGRLVT